MGVTSNGLSRPSIIRYVVVCPCIPEVHDGFGGIIRRVPHERKRLATHRRYERRTARSNTGNVVTIHDEARHLGVRWNGNVRGGDYHPHLHSLVLRIVGCTECDGAVAVGGAIDSAVD